MIKASNVSVNFFQIIFNNFMQGVSKGDRRGVGFLLEEREKEFLLSSGKVATTWKWDARRAARAPHYRGSAIQQWRRGRGGGFVSTLGWKVFNSRPSWARANQLTHHLHPGPFDLRVIRGFPAHHLALVHPRHLPRHVDQRHVVRIRLGNLRNKWNRKVAITFFFF